MSAEAGAAQLEALRQKIAKLPGVANKIAEKVAPMVSSAARDAFEGQRDPYGAGWGPNRNGVVPELQDTGALVDSATNYVADGDRIVASMPAYARYQNPRRWVPSRAKGLPDAYRRLVEDAGVEIVQELLA